MFDHITNGLKKADFKHAFKDALFAAAPEMENQNREQLKEGKKSDDTKLSPYSDAYAKKRRKMGLQTSKKDLYVDGSLYQGLYALPFEKYVAFGGKTKTMEYMANLEGIDILGLTEKSISIVNEDIIDNTIRFFLDDIKL